MVMAVSEHQTSDFPMDQAPQGEWPRLVLRAMCGSFGEDDAPSLPKDTGAHAIRRESRDVPRD